MNNISPETLLIGLLILVIFYLYSTQESKIEGESNQTDDFTVKKFESTVGFDNFSDLINQKSDNKYLIFLDIDGTITQFPGEHPEGLFSLFFSYGMKCFKNRRVILNLFESEKNLEAIKQFLQTLCSLPREQVEIVIVTNNFREAIQELWTNVLGCPWDRIHSRSAFRGSPLNKGELIDTFLQEPLWNSWKIYYLEDDPRNLDNLKNIKELSRVNVIDCQKDWVAKKLIGFSEQ